MALEFQRPFNIDPNAVTPGERSLDRLNQTFGNIGQQALQYRQQQIENQRQAMMMKWRGNQEAREAQGNQPLSDFMNPGAGQPGPQGPSPSGSLQQGTNGPQPNVSMDNGSPGYAAPGSTMPQPYTQMASAGVSDTGPDLTSHFNAWKSQGLPQQYSHPELQGQSQNQSPNPMQGFDPNTFARLPGSQRGAYTSLFKEAGSFDLQKAEAEKNRAMAKYYATTKGQPQSYLSGLSWDTATPQQQGMAEAMRRGDIRPADLSFRDKGQIVALAQERATMTGQPFQSYGGDVKRGVAEQFSYGKPAQNVNALNTALGHLDSLNKAFQDVQNTNQAWMNIPINKLRTMTNDPAVVKLDATLNAVQGEAANVFKGGSGATDQEIASWRNVFNRNLTPGQAIGVIKQTGELFQSRLSALQYQRDNGMHGQPGRGQLLSPHGAQLMQKFEGQGGESGGGMIRVRNKQTGQTGQLPAGNFDATKYDQLQ